MQYPRDLKDRWKQQLSDFQRRLKKLESRTAAIDSGYPLAALPAVIDSGYTTGNPKAYLNGSTTLTGPYEVFSSYSPVAGDSVLALPIPAQRTYIIAGSTDGAGGGGGGGGGGFANPMTAAGDLIDGGTGGTAQRLAGNTSTTRNFLTSTGTGSAANTPAWATIASGDLPTGTTGAQGALQLDGTAADFQPDGVAAAGSVGKAADAGHVHPEKAWQSAWLMPSGALEETFPRWVASTLLSPTTTTVYVTAIALPAGVTVSNITLISGSTAGTSPTHRWAALADPTGKVLAVSADQATTTWSASALVTHAMTTPYAVTSGGLYYLAFSATETGMGNWMAANLSYVYGIQRTPVLCGTAGTSSTPPSVGATLTITAATANFYGYVS